jgi:hypothetical protein
MVRSPPPLPNLLTCSLCPGPAFHPRFSWAQQFQSVPGLQCRFLGGKGLYLFAIAALFLASLE